MTYILPRHLAGECTLITGIYLVHTFPFHVCSLYWRSQWFEANFDLYTPKQFTNSLAIVNYLSQRNFICSLKVQGIVPFWFLNLPKEMSFRLKISPNIIQTATNASIELRFTLPTVCNCHSRDELRLAIDLRSASSESLYYPKEGFGDFTTSFME